MKKFSTILFISILITSCAKIPIQSITLMDNILNEGKRMHSLNILMTNKLFDEKREKIDDFIMKDYTPKFIAEFTSKLPNDVDVKGELNNIILKIIPKVNVRRDAMQNALEANRIKIIDKLNQDYREYDIMCNELKRLLQSAVKVNDESKKLVSQVSAITKNNIDFEKLEATIDGFIGNSGDFGQNVDSLNESVNKLLNK